jgi:H+-transporting ATPase
MTGLSDAEAQARLTKFGPNSLSYTDDGLWQRLFHKLIAPVPCMLEATVVLEVCLGKRVEAIIISLLILFNALLGFVQEGRAQSTLRSLRSRLALNASVQRDGAWKIVAATQLVPGDLVKLTLGAVVAADVKIIDGSVLLDESMLTGESVPLESGSGVDAYASALVRRGEATAEVTATGSRTKFGRAAELVRTARVTSSQQKAVLRVVAYLAGCNGIITLGMLAYAHARNMPAGDVIALGLTAVLASIPVALPATFTLAAALGARTLAKIGVLSTRLSAVDEAASMDVLCVDKTGTLTANSLTVVDVTPGEGMDKRRVLQFAALASSDAGQDPVDAAIRAAAAASRMTTDTVARTAFLPFDPATKRSEAVYDDPHGKGRRVVKGAASVVFALAAPTAQILGAARSLESQGFRVLAVAAGPPEELRSVGLVALSDPPRADSAALIRELDALGVKTIMVTGDAASTAETVARLVGLGGRTCPRSMLPTTLRPDDFSVFAGVLPEDKYSIVKLLQAGNHVVGMCGDGANDAPALRQAHIGIAVSTATDVAKAAAGVVLTNSGLGGIVATVKEGRQIFQRILTYVLNSTTKKIAQVLFLAGGLVMTGHAVLTPLLMVIVMVTGDFLGMSLTTDNVRPSPHPNAWPIRKLAIAGATMGLCQLLFCLSMLAVGQYVLRLGVDATQTLAFLIIVFGNQATTYNNRERRHLWSSRPSAWVLVCSAADITIAASLAVFGIAMKALDLEIVLTLLLAAALFCIALDFIKVPTFKSLRIE